MAALSDDDITRLQTLLDELPAPLQPLDVSALDGFLCGVLLQPRPLPPTRWLPHVFDIDGRAPPAGARCGRGCPARARCTRRAS